MYVLGDKNKVGQFPVRSSRDGRKCYELLEEGKGEPETWSQQKRDVERIPKTPRLFFPLLCELGSGLDTSVIRHCLFLLFLLGIGGGQLFNLIPVKTSIRYIVSSALRRAAGLASRLRFCRGFCGCGERHGQFVYLRLTFASFRENKQLHQMVKTYQKTENLSKRTVGFYRFVSTLPSSSDSESSQLSALPVKY